jgi:ribonuclease HI
MTKQHKPYPILVFADGACSGNPGPGGWGAIIVLPEGHVTELGGPRNPTTNNQMELTATIRALDRIADRPDDVEIFTDSVYVIKGITQWIWGWRKNGWKTAEGAEVSNQDLWKQLSGVLGERRKRHPDSKLEWKWVKGHSGVPGNDRADEIGVLFSKGSRPGLYDGPLLGYGVAIHDIPDNTELPELKPRVAKAPAHSYLSLLGSTPMRHANWAECERRVKGQSGAKFKKAASPEEETAILRSWGYQPKDLKS